MVGISVVYKLLELVPSNEPEQSRVGIIVVML
jgi:hypothetical protein